MDKDYVALQISAQLFLYIATTHKVLLKEDDEVELLKTLGKRLVLLEEQDYEDFPFEWEQLEQMSAENYWYPITLYFDGLIEKYIELPERPLS